MIISKMFMLKLIFVIFFFMNYVTCSENTNYVENTLKRMDLSVKPCDDFYKFVCGNAFTGNIPLVSKLDNAVFVVLSVLMKLVHELGKSMSSKEPKSFHLLQSYYNTCKNTGEIMKSSENDIRDILKTLGGWPVLSGNSWNESGFNWMETTSKLSSLGYPLNFLINVTVEIDQKNTSRMGIHLDQSIPGEEQEALLQGMKNKDVQNYWEKIVHIAEKFGANRKQAERELSDSLNFEIELAKISLSENERLDKDKLYNPMTVADLQIKYPKIPWLEYLNGLIAPVKISSSEVINVKVPTYLESLFELILVTPKRILANYMMTNVVTLSIDLIDNLLPIVNDKIIENGFERTMECAGKVYSDMNLASKALYVRKHFNDKKIRENVIEIIENLRANFKDLIAKTEWLDENTKKASLEKLENVAYQVAYSNEFFDDKKLDGFYQDLKIYDKSFLKTQLSLIHVVQSKGFELINKPLNRSNWIFFWQPESPYYAYEVNSIEVPFSFLQGIYYSKDRPEYLNYAAIGAMIGHELTHGFDKEGIHHDKDGNLVDWWQPESEKEFTKRAQCLIDQYGNTTVKEVNLNINGTLTSGENIADHGGLKLAYAAYNEWEKRNGVEPQLPGMNYTSQQMFWIGYANVWCSKYKPEFLKKVMTTDPHTPDEFRVNIPLSNLPEFSKDFSCRLNSRMNPKIKCAVW